MGGAEVETMIEDREKDKEATGNHIRLIRPIAQMAVSAYADTHDFGDPDIPTILTSEMLQVWTQPAFSNTQVHIALVEEWDPKFKTSGKTVAAVFAFRGMQPWCLSGWLIDFDSDKDPINWWPAACITATSHNAQAELDAASAAGPQAHSGFLYAFNSVAVRPWPEKASAAMPCFGPDDRKKTLDGALLRQIDEYNLLCPDKRGFVKLDAAHLTRIICTGHGLGGALATLAAAWARVALRHLIPAADELHVSCVTLGSPPAGDERFAEMFRVLQHRREGKEDADCSSQTIDCVRIVHAMDPVPMIAPAQWGFQHVGQPIWLLCWNMIKQKKCGDVDLYYRNYRGHSALRPLYASFYILDHLAYRYTDALDRVYAEKDPNAFTSYVPYLKGGGHILEQFLSILSLGIVFVLGVLSMLLKKSIKTMHGATARVSSWVGSSSSEATFAGSQEAGLRSGVSNEPLTPSPLDELPVLPRQDVVIDYSSIQRPDGSDVLEDIKEMQLPTNAVDVVAFVEQILLEKPSVLAFPASWWWANDFVDDMADQLEGSYWQGPAGSCAVWFLSMLSWGSVNKGSAQSSRQTQKDSMNVACTPEGTTSDQPATELSNKLDQLPSGVQQQGGAEVQQTGEVNSGQQQEEGEGQSMEQPSGSQKQSESERPHARPAVAARWAEPERGEACSHCKEDDLSELTQLSPASSSSQGPSKRLRLVLQETHPVGAKGAINMEAKLDFMIWACVHTVSHGSKITRHICVKIDSLKSQITSKNRKTREALYLESTTLDVSAVTGNTWLALQPTVDEKNPECELRVLRRCAAPEEILASDDLNWSVGPKFSVTFPGGEASGEFFTLSGIRTGRSRLKVLKGEIFDIDACEALGSSACLDRCRIAMAATYTWKYRDLLALCSSDKHGPVVFTAPLASDAAEVIITINPSVEVVHFPSAVDQKVLIKKSKLAADPYQFPECKISVACPPPAVA